MSRKQKIDIDRAKVRIEACKANGSGLRVWLGCAMFIADYAHLRDMLTDETTQPDVLRAVRELHCAALDIGPDCCSACSSGATPLYVPGSGPGRRRAGEDVSPQEMTRTSHL